MPAKSKKPVPETLGSFEQVEALALSEALARIVSIASTVRRLMVGARNDQPTEWWLVEVHPRRMLDAAAFLRGWKAGQTHQRILRHQEYHRGTYAEAAHRLGYIEIMPVTTSQTPAEEGK